MQTLNFKEIKSQLTINAGTAHGNGYGCWVISSHIGCYDNKVELKKTVHDESWSTGEFAGEEYNPQDFVEWERDYFEPEFAHVSDDAKALISDEMKEKMFESWCEKLWSDSANSDNYEPREHLAQRIADELWSDCDESVPDRFFVIKEKQIAYILDEAEYDWVSEPEHQKEFEMLCEGNGAAFEEAYANRED